MRLLPTILPLLLLTTPTLAAPKPSDVQAKILADTTAIKPNTPFTIAIVLTTQPDWHIYWKNPGDGGTPTKFTYHLPEGFKVQPAEFPLPTKFSQPGDITTYGYTGTTLFLATITPPPNAKDLPEKITITVNASWLCCNDSCVPGNAKLSLDLPTSTDADLIAKARKIPSATPPADLVTVTPSPDQSLTLDWKKSAPLAVQIFPLALEGLEVTSLENETTKNQTHITLHSRILKGHELKQPQLPLLVVYTDDQHIRHGFFTNIPLQPPPASIK